MADEGRLLQVLINLLVNASQAVQREGHVILRSRLEDGWVLLQVEDNGPGIPPEIESKGGHARWDVESVKQQLRALRQQDG